MTSLQDFGRERRLRELSKEAVRWRALVAESDETTNEAFADWLVRSPDHVQVWLELTAFDEEVAQSLHFPPLGSLFSAVPNCTPSLVAANTPKAALPTRRSPLGLITAGAALLVAIALVAVPGFRMFATDRAHYTTAIGEHRTFDLDDGSTVRLNTNSRVDILFTSRSRTVRLLTGEAMFDVAHDANRPFDVTSSCGTVRAVGTSFLVRATEAKSCELVVAEGLVSVSRTGAPRSTVPVVMVSAGENADIGQNGVIVRGMSSEQVQRRLAWLRGQLSFQGEPLSEIVSKFNRYNVEQVVIDDQAVAATRLGGSFRATDARGFVRSLERGFGIRSRTVHQPSGAVEIHLRSERPTDTDDSSPTLRHH